MITLEEILEKKDHTIIFIRPEFIRSIRVCVDLHADSSSVLLSVDGETFDDENRIWVNRGERYEVPEEAQMLAVGTGGLGMDGGMISWSKNR